MNFKIKTASDYRNAVYKLAGGQTKFAKLLHHYSPDSNFTTLLRTIQKKVNGESRISNNDILIINLVAALAEIKS